MHDFPDPVQNFGAPHNDAFDGGEDKAEDEPLRGDRKPATKRHKKKRNHMQNIDFSVIAPPRAQADGHYDVTEEAQFIVGQAPRRLRLSIKQWQDVQGLVEEGIRRGRSAR